MKTFRLTDKEEEKAAEFMAKVESERGSSYAGASGGATTYEFTPTSLGIVKIIRHFGKELDLSDYEEW